MDLPADLGLDDGVATVRRARLEDVPALVDLLTDDALGRRRESSDPGPYLRAFTEIDADPAHLLVVVERDGDLVATCQLTVLPGLARAGARRGQVEAVRVHRAHRGTGLGGALVRWTVEEARRRGCDLVQLTTDRARPEAHRFYRRLGFTGSHVGFKLDLRR